LYNLLIRNRGYLQYLLGSCQSLLNDDLVDISSAADRHFSTIFDSKLILHLSDQGRINPSGQSVHHSDGASTIFCRKN